MITLVHMYMTQMTSLLVCHIFLFSTIDDDLLNNLVNYILTIDTISFCNLHNTCVEIYLMITYNTCSSTR